MHLILRTEGESLVRGYDVHTLEQERSLQEILAKHSSLFTKELGCLKGMEVELNINPNATPKFFTAHTVPLALREGLKES